MLLHNSKLPSEGIVAIEVKKNNIGTFLFLNKVFQVLVHEVKFGT